MPGPVLAVLGVTHLIVSGRAVDDYRALGIALLQGPRPALFLMSKVPLWEEPASG